jgi:midasin
MRNRGIELFLLPPHDELAAPAPSVDVGADEHAELRQVLGLAGVPGGALPAAMAAAHAAVAAHAGHRHR